jgi:ribosomal protein L11 methylase PrmA
MHLHLHAAAQRRVSAPVPSDGSIGKLSPAALSGIVNSLERTVRKLVWSPPATTWGDYYGATNYSESAFAHKREIVESAIDRLRPATVWDLGANDGTFSRVATARGLPTVAFDIDPVAVEKNYQRTKQDADTHMLPLRLDLTNPSGRCGWASEEREALEDRGPADLLLALALVHHLAIAHNVPLPRVADFLARLGRALVIEFVPKSDSQVRRMLASRADIFDDYTQEAFVRAFERRFEILEAIPVRDAMRTVYLMRAAS